MTTEKPVASHDWERPWWDHGYSLVAGVDEVGRGALAGPLVAAAVILPCCNPDVPSALAGLSDSKVHTSEQRECWFVRIQSVAVEIGIGFVECEELDDIGLGAANRMAMERAVFALKSVPNVVLLDAVVTELSLPQSGIIDGDALCLSIAAASVIAKVTRDRIMCDLHRADSRYGFATHKGYGTEAHLEALKVHGPTSVHRRCFAPIAALLERV